MAQWVAWTVLMKDEVLGLQWVLGMAVGLALMMVLLRDLTLEMKMEDLSELLMGDLMLLVDCWVLVRVVLMARNWACWMVLVMGGMMVRYLEIQ